MLESPMSRRDLLRRGASATFAGALAAGIPSCADARARHVSADVGNANPAPLQELEAQHAARLGVWAINHRTGETLAWRAGERFAFCSTYKGLLAARVLRDFDHSPTSLKHVVHYSRRDLVEGSPVTSAFQSDGLTVRSLCAAAIAYSDNTAANLLFELTGGPHGLQRFLRSLGDVLTQSERTEPTVNDFAPGDLRDTTTPWAIGRDYTQLLLGDALSKPHRALLRSWMEGDAVNVTRFGAGLPVDWLIADKTGTGFSQIANDVGVVWTPRGTALTISVLTEKSAPTAAPDDALVAAAARIVAHKLAPGEL